MSSCGLSLSLAPRCPCLAGAALDLRMFARHPPRQQCHRVTGWEGLYTGRKVGVRIRKGGRIILQTSFLFCDYREPGFFIIVIIIIIEKRKPSTGRGGLLCSHLSGFTPGTGCDTWNFEVQGIQRTWSHSVLGERENSWVTVGSLQLTCF